MKKSILMFKSFFIVSLFQDRSMVYIVLKLFVSHSDVISYTQLSWCGANG